MTSVVYWEQVFEAIQQEEYLTFVAFVAVGYDYILTFSDEINYIWNKPWTRISTLFVIARYCGLCFVVTTFVYGSTFLPDLRKMWVPIPRYMLVDIDHGRLILNSCDVVTILNQWSLCIFTAATDLAMILRVWALCNRPRFILATLIPLYVTEVMTSLVLSIVCSIRTNPSSSVALALNYMYCVLPPIPFLLPLIVVIAQVVLCVSMSLFVIIQFVKESLIMYAVTKRYQLGHYMNVLTGQNTVYLLIIATLSFLHLLLYFKESIPVWWILPGYILVFTLVPRFTLSLRALYARDVQGRRGSNLDTAFGLTRHCAINTTVAQSGHDEVLEESEEIAMDEKEICDGAGTSAV